MPAKPASLLAKPVSSLAKHASLPAKQPGSAPEPPLLDTQVNNENEIAASEEPTKHVNGPTDALLPVLALTHENGWTFSSNTFK